jgi:hypothetical protein
MRNPHSTRALLLTLGMLFGWGLFTLAFFVPQEPEWIPLSVALPGILIGVILPSFALHEIMVWRRFDRMRRGVGIVARWQVTPSRMQQFAERHDELNATLRPTAMSVPYPAPDGEFTVIIGRDFVMAGSEMHPIHPYSEVQSFGTALQFSQGVAPVAQSDMMRFFRLPIGANAFEQVAQVVAHFATVRTQYMNPRRKLKVALVFFGVLAAFILFVGWLTDWK